MVGGGDSGHRFAQPPSNHNDAHVRAAVFDQRAPLMVTLRVVRPRFGDRNHAGRSSRARPRL